MAQVASNVVVLNRKRAVKSKRIEAWDLSRLADLRLYGDEFVFNTASGVLHRLSRTAGFILHELKQGQSAENIAPRLQTFYGISQSRAERDLEFFFSDLATLGLIEPRHREDAASFRAN